jgi:hypothetical protein
MSKETLLLVLAGGAVAYLVLSKRQIVVPAAVVTAPRNTAAPNPPAPSATPATASVPWYQSIPWGTVATSVGDVVGNLTSSGDDE